MTWSAMVLAAGLGTRLRPFTAQRPKPLLPWGDSTPLALALTALRGAGFGPLVVNGHHALPALRQALAEPWGEGVRLSEEIDLLGSAGGVRAAWDRGLLPARPLCLWNGDMLLGPPLQALRAAPEPFLTLAVTLAAPQVGPVGVAEDGRVVRLRNVRLPGEAEWRGAHYVGVAALGPETLALLPQVGCLIGDFAIPQLLRGAPVRWVDHAAPWTDMGTPADYGASQLAWLAARREGHWAAKTARIGSDVRLRQSIIGAGAQVDGEGELREVIVWPGASCRAPLSRQIVTEEGAFPW